MLCVLLDVVVQVVDLLVAMCRAALESPRKSIIFEPYPSVVDPTDPKTLAFNPKVTVHLLSCNIIGCLYFTIPDMTLLITLSDTLSNLLTDFLYDAAQ